MATVGNTVSGAPHGQAGDSGGPQDLVGKIDRTENELKTVKQAIEELNKRLDDNDFTETGRYSSAEKVEAALQRLEAKEARLRELLVQYETRLTAQQQQQQSGAGASALFVDIKCV